MLKFFLLFPLCFSSHKFLLFLLRKNRYSMPFFLSLFFLTSHYAFSFSTVRTAGVSCLLPICTLSTCPSDPMFCSSSYFSPPLLSFLTSCCPLALFHCNRSKHLPLKNCTFDPTWFFISYLIAYLCFIPKLIEGAVYNYRLETLFCDSLL